MSWLYIHLAEIAETADGGFDMTRKGRQFFSRFLRQHGKALRNIKTHAALVEMLRECNAADFAALRQRMLITSIRTGCAEAGIATNAPMHRLVA